jgi:hypothetical protein
MPQTVLITGTGRPYALGFNLVRRYLENGDQQERRLRVLRSSEPEHRVAFSTMHGGSISFAGILQ